METATLTLDRAEAARLFRKYREHKAYQKPIDAEIERVYSLISKGKVIVQAIKSVADAGVGTDRLPKLALVRADAKICYFRGDQGGGTMSDMSWVPSRMARSRYIEFPRGTFPPPYPTWKSHESIVPLIPVEHRPRRGIENYHILYEAIWTRSAPVDPMLLRRIGKNNDIFVVVAAWDLTAVERAALEGSVLGGRQ